MRRHWIHALLLDATYEDEQDCDGGSGTSDGKVYILDVGKIILVTTGEKRLRSDKWLKYG